MTKKPLYFDEEENKSRILTVKWNGVDSSVFEWYLNVFILLCVFTFQNYVNLFFFLGGGGGVRMWLALIRTSRRCVKRRGMQLPWACERVEVGRKQYSFFCVWHNLYLTWKVWRFVSSLLFFLLKFLNLLDKRPINVVYHLYVVHLLCIYLFLICSFFCKTKKVL